MGGLGEERAGLGDARDASSLPPDVPARQGEPSLPSGGSWGQAGGSPSVAPAHHWCNGEGGTGTGCARDGQRERLCPCAGGCPGGCTPGRVLSWGGLWGPDPAETGAGVFLCTQTPQLGTQDPLGAPSQQPRPPVQEHWGGQGGEQGRATLCPGVMVQGTPCPAPHGGLDLGRVLVPAQLFMGAGPPCWHPVGTPSSPAPGTPPHGAAVPAGFPCPAVRPWGGGGAGGQPGVRPPCLVAATEPHEPRGQRGAQSGGHPWSGLRLLALPWTPGSLPVAEFPGWPSMGRAGLPVLVWLGERAGVPAVHNLLLFITSTPLTPSSVRAGVTGSGSCRVPG